MRFVVFNFHACMTACTAELMDCQSTSYDLKTSSNICFTNTAGKPEEIYPPHHTTWKRKHRRLPRLSQIFYMCKNHRGQQPTEEQVVFKTQTISSSSTTLKGSSPVSFLKPTSWHQKQEDNF